VTTSRGRGQRHYFDERDQQLPRQRARRKRQQRLDPRQLGVRLRRRDFSVSGNLTLDSNGNVTQAAAATVAVTGTTAINSRGANRDVTLNLANDFGGAVSVAPAANTTRNVNLQDANALTLGTVTATGTLTAVAAGAITDAGNLTITGTTTLTAGAANDITLDGVANNFATCGSSAATTSRSATTLRFVRRRRLGGPEPHGRREQRRDAGGWRDGAVAGTTTINTRGRIAMRRLLGRTISQLGAATIAAATG
jgi:hypothetical protein